jgi:hypothetical protein
VGGLLNFVGGLGDEHCLCFVTRASGDASAVDRTQGQIATI